MAGADCLKFWILKIFISFNVAYKNSKNAVKLLGNIRNKLEEDLDMHIPLNLMLKGR